MKKKINLQCILLTFLTFTMGLSQFIIIGIINNLSTDFRVSIADIGALVTIFAIVYAVATPIINLFIGSIALHKVMLFFMLIFSFGNLLTAIASNFNVLLMSRIITALSSGPLMSTAVTFAAAIAPQRKRAWLISWVFSGFSIASVFGVPLGTWISDNLNWRLTFWTIFFASVFITIVVFYLLPHNLTQIGTHNIFKQLAILKDKRIIWGILVPVFNFGAIYIIYTYLKPILIKELSFSHNNVIIVLFLYGLCGLVSNQVSGRIANMKWKRNLKKFFILQAISIFLIFISGNLTWLKISAILIMALTMSISNSPMQLYYMDIAKQNYPQSLVLASSFNSIFSNVGVATGSAIGGYVVANVGLSGLGIAGSVFSVFTIGVLTILIKYNYN
ncbi:MAG TPA: MFS transporter [Lactobacillus sp.]|nr:MFS transporter [Lactobacillus sp.]